MLQSNLGSEVIFGQRWLKWTRNAPPTPNTSFFGCFSCRYGLMQAYRGHSTLPTPIAKWLEGPTGVVSAQGSSFFKAAKTLPVPAASSLLLHVTGPALVPYVT